MALPSWEPPSSPNEDDASPVSGRALASCGRKLKKTSKSSRGFASRKQQAKQKGKRNRAQAESTNARVSFVDMLLNFRNTYAADTGGLPFQILNIVAISELVQERPTTLEGLAQLPSIGQAKSDQFGQRLLDVLREFEESRPQAVAVAPADRHLKRPKSGPESETESAGLSLKTSAKRLARPGNTTRHASKEVVNRTEM
jgi:ribonuclease D